MTDVVTESAIRQLINELLDDVTSGAVLAPNPVVDPSKIETDPTGEHKPQDKTELNVAVQRLTKDLPDERANQVFDFIKTALDNKKDTAPKMSSSSKNKSQTQKVEAQIRGMIRNILKEDYQAYDAIVRGDAKPEAVVDDDNAIFTKIADEFGMSIPGAKQLVDKAMARWKFLSNQPTRALKAKQSGGEDVTEFDPNATNLEDLDVMILKAWADYIELLNKSGELTPADVQLMHDHPEVALELDGFREFLSEYVMGSIKPVDKSGNAWLGTLPDDVDPNLNADKPEGKRSGKRTFQNAPAYGGDYEWMEPEDEEEDAVKANKIRKKAASRVVNKFGEE